jgi:sugar phosphate isomerase/epimerase
MKTIKGPGIFLAQFIGAQAPFNTLEGLAQWAAGLGYQALQIPCNHPAIFDVERAAASQTYCDEVSGILAEQGLAIGELSTHLEGQLVAVHPAYDTAFDAFAPAALRGNPQARQQWAVEKVRQAAVASARLGLKAHATFSGALAWPYFYPWPPHNQPLLDEAFDELARRWRPLLDVFDEQGVDVCYEIHPGEDLHDGVTFERFLQRVDNHPRCNMLYDPSHLHLQQMDYLAYIDIYHSRIKAFHVKDAEFRRDGRSGVYGGYQNWQQRAGRFRSLGDGQIDFKTIFSKLTEYDFDGWAVLEWECCLKDAEVGAREGSEFIRRHIIPVSGRAFDDFAAGKEERMIQVGIIGSGFIGPAHLEALRRVGDIEVVALCDGSLEMAQQKARQLNVAHAYGSVEALLAHPGLQVVHNCTPNHLHARINRQILSAGLHVFQKNRSA